MKKALISVSNKEGLVEFARGLEKLGYEIISTGGTYSTIQEAGIKVTKVADITGFPEILGGRVKTLHPKIHGGILARRVPEHLQQLQENDIGLIDIVAVNLYHAEGCRQELSGCCSAGKAGVLSTPAGGSGKTGRNQPGIPLETGSGGFQPYCSL